MGHFLRFLLDFSEVFPLNPSNNSVARFKDDGDVSVQTTLPWCGYMPQVFIAFRSVFTVNKMNDRNVQKQFAM